jgi:hypothetical protein
MPANLERKAAWQITNDKLQIATCLYSKTLTRQVIYVGAFGMAV